MRCTYKCKITTNYICCFDFCILGWVFFFQFKMFSTYKKDLALLLNLCLIYYASILLLKGKGRVQMEIKEKRTFSDLFLVG